jgi:hypothetical protein
MRSDDNDAVGDFGSNEDMDLVANDYNEMSYSKEKF